MSKQTAYGVIGLLLLSNIIAISCAMHNNPGQFNLTENRYTKLFSEADSAFWAKPNFKKESTEFRITKGLVTQAKQPKSDLPTLLWAKDTIVAQALYNEIKELGIKHPDIVLCQVILETGHFTSNAYHTRNNLLGLGGDQNLKRFRTKRESLEYYKRWQSKLYNETTRNSTQWAGYYDFLERLFKDNRSRWLRYAEDPQYVYKLKRIHQMVFGNQKKANAIA